MAPDTHSARPDLRTRRPSQVYHHKLDAAPARPAGAADRLLIGAFLVGIWLPLLGLVFGLDSAFVLNENRVLAARPHWSWDRAAMADFPRRFDAYFNDRFGFRKRLIGWLSLAKVSALGISTSEDVVVGRDGWLFYTGAGASDNFRGTDPFSREQLAAWARMLQRRHDWLARRGVRYLVAIAPNKETIYPEFMPRALDRVRPESRLDQLLPYLKEHTTVSVVDLREPLLAAKERGRLYYRTDSHWNSRGAYLGYRRILEGLSAWFPGLAPMPDSAFEPVHFPRGGLDLAVMLGLSDWLTETAFELSPRAPRSARKAGADCRMPPWAPDYQRPFATELDDPKLPRAVVFRDSFCNVLWPFLSEHFRRVVYAWKYTLDEELVGRERPDVVIQEFVERSLMWDIPVSLDNDLAPGPVAVWKGREPAGDPRAAASHPK